MTDYYPSVPSLFKGIALFTPGGDLIYGIDPHKQAHWHIHLCVGLQEILGLPETPHFLVPGYTATVDRWLDPRTQQIVTFAEVYPAVKRYQPLLEAIFEIEESVWQVASWQEEYCDPMILAAHQQQFPQLWEEHELIVRLDPQPPHSLSLKSVDQKAALASSTITGYILRLFISNDHAATETTLASIHRLLEEGLAHPYTLKVINISQHPEQAEKHHVSATPTLVRVYPQPVKRIVGELEDWQKVLQIISSF